MNNPETDGKFGILYLHNKSAISGGERSLLNLWENLDRDKFCPYVIIPERGELSRQAEKLGVVVLFFPVPQIALKNFLKIIRFMLFLGAQTKKNKINIIHSYTPRNNILSAIVGRLTGIPVIWHERNLILEGEPDVTRKYLFLPERIICNSRAVAGRFMKDGRIPSKVDVVLNGVNVKRFHPDVKSERVKEESGIGNKKVVGVISNLNKRKRVEYLLEAASMILEKNQDVLFMVVGGEFSDDGSQELEGLKSRAKKLGLNEHIVFTGFQENVAEYLSVFDVSVHVTKKEACSRVILESMAAGKPVVAMNDGGNPELVEDGITGILTEPEDLNGFVEAVVGLLADEQKRKEMGERGAKRVREHFAIDHNTKRTEEIYLQLIKK